MTCIAWDGKTLAADKLMLHGATRKTTTKIHRHGVELLAVAGDISIGVSMRNWYTSGADPEKFPKRSAEGNASLMVIRADRTAWRYEDTPVPFQCEGRFCAWGSGDESAMIAMACGKTAREAVLLVAEYNNGCGNGVDTLELE